MNADSNGNNVNVNVIPIMCKEWSNYKLIYTLTQEGKVINRSDPTSSLDHTFTAVEPGSYVVDVNNILYNSCGEQSNVTKHITIQGKASLSHRCLINVDFCSFEQLCSNFNWETGVCVHRWFFYTSDYEVDRKFMLLKS